MIRELLVAHSAGINLTGLLLAAAGAFVGAYEVIKPFKGERFEAGFGSAPIGAVPSNDPPIETELFLEHDRRRFRWLRNGLWMVGGGTILQLLAELVKW